ncbi:MAG: glutamate-1-semialdehyde 2,1-aminomutase [Spirochaetia bacterium]|nr:glutamate-1-semialdehyde 2,1-aminomutase [Spirochaetia bacterium]
MKNDKSKEIWNRSLNVFPGGVNSPVRAYNSVGGGPISVREGRGAYITDEDNNSFLDFVNSWGPLILGHCDKDVTAAIVDQASRGVSFGAVTRYECELAELITQNIKHIEQIRFVSSGTEAVMSALRLARGYTGRNKIIKFEGCYHGHSDSLLVKAGSGLLTFSGDISESSSPGVPDALSRETLVLPLDDEAAVKNCFEKFGDGIAAVIIEPLPANSGLLKQRPEFIQFLRDITKKYKSLLIMDEVISGFRLGFSGFCGKYSIEPDLVTYGKIIGGGLPVGAFAGKREIMKNLSPQGKIYQAGTLSGNPLAMVAGKAALGKLLHGGVYEKLDRLSGYLVKKFHDEVAPVLAGKKYYMELVSENSVFWLNITSVAGPAIRKVTNIWEKAPEVYSGIFWQLLENGVHIAPSAYEVGFISNPMEEGDIDHFILSLASAIKNS